MNIKRYKPIVLPAGLLFLYLIAVWSESAYFASTLEFNELLTCQKLLPAFAAVRWEHVQKLAPASIPMEIVSVVGLLVAIVVGLAPRFKPARGLVALYTAILLLAGGWMGLFALPRDKNEEVNRARISKELLTYPPFTLNGGHSGADSGSVE